MHIHLYPEDLDDKFKKSPKNVTLADFPLCAHNKYLVYNALCIVFHYGNEVKVLKSPPKRT